MSSKISEFFVGTLQGEKCGTIQEFLVEIGSVFNFPTYYGNNMNAFWECINDLNWINEKNYILDIKNTNLFLNQESVDTKNNLLRDILQISIEWMNVPNFEGEDQFRKKSEFKVLFN